MPKTDHTATTTTPISIKGLVIHIPKRYAEGHVLNAQEAAVLNQTYCENVRNNQSKVVEAFLAKHEGTLSPEEEVALRAKVMEYVQSYSFAGPRAPRVPVDPVEVEAQKLAKSALGEALAKKGHAISQMDKNWVAEKVAELLETRPQYRKMAKDRVEALKALTTEGLEELQLPEAQAAQ